MRLRWVGVIVAGAVLVTLFACAGLFVLYSLVQTSGVSGDHVAVIPVHGSISTRSSGGIFASDSASAQSIINQLESAREDDAVKGVMLDIDSPGGGVVAADQIHAAVVRTREAGLPVVAYFGDTAASAAYYIAAPSDRIVANPGTMTGSIGAIAVVPNYEELYEKLGIDMQIVSTGEFKDMLQPSREMTEDERDVLQEILDESYDEFLNVVAEGRDMSLDEARELADGRVYSGIQGQENGLVDDLGDRRDALDITGELSGLGDDPPARTYQQDVGFWDVFWGNSRELVSSLTPFDAEIDPRSFHLEIRYELR